MHTTQSIMIRLREEPPNAIGGYSVNEVIDYKENGTGLPKADVLEYRFENGAKLMVRPSGTEPKIKVYLSAAGKNAGETDAVNAALGKSVRGLLY